MKNIFNNMIKEAIAYDIFAIILGVFLLCNPRLATTVTGVLFGVFLTISGLYMISNYIFNRNTINMFRLSLGLLTLIMGIIFLINPILLSSVITLIIGIWIIISGIIKLLLAIKFKIFNEETWIINIVISILTICIGILLVVNPFKSYIVISTYIGIMFIVYFSMDLVEKMIMKKRFDQIEKILFNK